MTESGLAARIRDLLRGVADFPKPGIDFKDIAPVLADGPTFAAVIEGLARSVDADIGSIDLVAGIEARGFLIAGALARELGCGLLPVRKAGKLPPPTVRKHYDLEYGSAELEIPLGATESKRVLLVDDVLATGGTLAASADLLTETGAQLHSIAVIVELSALGGRASVTERAPLTALLSL